MMDVVIPLVVGCCAVLVAYLLQKPVQEDGQKNPTNFFVIFCCGIVMGFVGTYLFGNAQDETINNVMREIDMLGPPF